jgi:hypothetical protein
VEDVTLLPQIRYSILYIRFLSKAGFQPLYLTCDRNINFLTNKYVNMGLFNLAILCYILVFPFRVESLLFIRCNFTWSNNLYSILTGQMNLPAITGSCLL